MDNTFNTAFVAAGRGGNGLTGRLSLGRHLGGRPQHHVLQILLVERQRVVALHTIVSEGALAAVKVFANGHWLLCLLWLYSSRCVLPPGPLPGVSRVQQHMLFVALVAKGAGTELAEKEKFIRYFHISTISAVDCGAWCCVEGSF